MTNVGRGIGLLGLLALVTGASAQDNLDKGKTPEQLYASNCAICHKSPRGLGSPGGILGVESFLREHYTTSSESAAAIARYLRAVEQSAPPERKRAARPPALESGKDKPADKKSTTRGTAKPADVKTDEPKLGKPDDKTNASKRKKPAEAKLPKSKPIEGMENKASDADKPQPRADETKASEAKPADAKPEAKPKPDATDSKTSN